MGNNKIVHMADLHVRFGSRHEEYRTVFKRAVKDIQSIKPRRIVIAGDLFHLKINLSPGAIELMVEFLRDLSKIAPVDITLGNHDMNEQDLSQGNAIKPIIDLIDNGFIITNDIKRIPVVDGRNSIYFYHDSGFYEIDDELIYGVYSLWDHEILMLDDKRPDKKYVAIYHGPVYGCMSDNGFIMKGDELIRPSTFNNFDIVMLGDIHEHQTFELNGKERMAYPGSTLQQDISEGLEKGYLLWDLEICEFERRFIPNDYGFSKLTIDKGEIWQERLEDLQMSFNPKKTKVYIEIVDDAENENVEKKSQIKKFIKQKWGCEFVDVQFRKELRTKILGVDTSQIDLMDETQWNQLLVNYYTENGYDNTEDAISLSKEIDKELNYKRPVSSGVEWDLVSMTTSNIFSHPVNPTYFPIDKMGGIIGIFGKNYSGKSNIIKALIWGLYQQVLGGGVGDNHRVINMYTGKNSAYVEIVVNIMGQLYKIYRAIEVKKKKDGSTEGKYKIDFTYWIEEEQRWETAESDRGAKEKPELKKMVLDAIGSFDNFTKVSLQTQGGKDDYLSLAQQEKNSLLREYNGLTICDLRYELANKKFNQIKNLQKNLGDPAEIEKLIQESKDLIQTFKTEIEVSQKEKDEANSEIEKHNDEILRLTKELEKVEEVSETNPEVITQLIENSQKSIEKIKIELSVKEEFLSNNFIKEIPVGFENVTIEKIEQQIEDERKKFQKDKDAYVKIQEWLKLNVVKEALPTEDAEVLLEKAKEKLFTLKTDLKISKGEKCPTCGSVTKKADPEKEKECERKIEQANAFVEEKQKFIYDQKTAEKSNQTIIQEQLKMDSLKNILEASKLNIEQLKFKKEQFSNMSSDLKHNQMVKNTSGEVTKLKELLESNSKLIEDKQKTLLVLSQNSEKIKNNDLVNNQIKSLQESLKGYKLAIYNSDRLINEKTGQVKIKENNIENYNEKLAQIKESVKTFNKFSVYLQAVSRDGIPAQILRNRLPLINYKINGILQNIVNFKIELSVKPNGDVQEFYYFNEDKSDALPLSLGSGSQKFIGSVAIRDALHYISCLVKPSFCIIDEGFGTLDDDKIGDINNVFSYLRNKYKAVLIITHKNEVKDSVDHIISVTKSTQGLTPEIIQANPEAGISQISFT